MPVCTSCKHNREVERLRTICAACHGSCSLQSSGKRDGFNGMVRIDAAADPMLVLREADENALAISRMPRLSRVKIDDPEVLQIVLHVVAEFGNVTDIQAPVLVRKLRGETNQQIADGMGLSQSVVWERWERIKRLNPTLAALDNGMIGKRGGGSTTHKPKPDGTDADGENAPTDDAPDDDPADG